MCFISASLKPTNQIYHHDTSTVSKNRSTPQFAIVNIPNKYNILFQFTGQTDFIFIYFGVYWLEL